MMDSNIRPLGLKPFEKAEFRCGSTSLTAGLLGGGAVVLTLLASFTPLGDKLGTFGAWMQNHQVIVVGMGFAVTIPSLAGIAFGISSIVRSLPERLKDNKPHPAIDEIQNIIQISNSEERNKSWHNYIKSNWFFISKFPFRRLSFDDERVSVLDNNPTSVYIDNNEIQRGAKYLQAGQNGYSIEQFQDKYLTLKIKIDSNDQVIFLHNKDVVMIQIKKEESERIYIYEWGAVNLSDSWFWTKEIIKKEADCVKVMVQDLVVQKTKT